MLYDKVNASGNCPCLTGIPPHIAILNEMAMLKEMMNLSSQDLKNTFKEELNNRE
jgi:anti-anti-sigma regulatory factor